MDFTARRLVLSEMVTYYYHVIKFRIQRKLYKNILTGKFFLSKLRHTHLRTYVQNVHVHALEVLYIHVQCTYVIKIYQIMQTAFFEVLSLNAFTARSAAVKLLEWASKALCPSLPSMSPILPKNPIHACKPYGSMLSHNPNDSPTNPAVHVTMCLSHPIGN